MQSANKLKYSGLYLIVITAVIALALMANCGKEKQIVMQIPPPPPPTAPKPVVLIYPPLDSFVIANNPTFTWHSVVGAVRYQLQVAKASDFVLRTINTETIDTTHTAVISLSNSTYFWRVRAQNGDSLWGDWSDATIWTFIETNYVLYFQPIAQISTYGVPQDLFMRNDTAYVADGQACLTLVDVSDPYNPTLLSNLEPLNDDFAKSVYVAPNDSFPYAYVADMDGKVEAMNVRDTTYLTNNHFGASQNLEELAGVIKSDTLWLLTVSSQSQSKLAFIQIIYTPFPENPYSVFEIELPANANGIFADTNYAYIANGSAGLKIVNITDIYSSSIISSQRLSGEALSVEVVGNYAYVACDRAGLYIVDVTNKTMPDTVAHVNTAGRCKDVQVLGNYIFMADADGGLKVVDATVMDSAHVVTAYATPYAYGIWADSSFIYICDRDNGLMVFRNNSF